MAEQVFSKTVEGSGWGEEDKVRRHDFVAEGELTVTITLAEYRMLLKQQGVFEKELEEAKSEKSKYYSECQKLKQTIETLREGLSEDDER